MSMSQPTSELADEAPGPLSPHKSAALAEPSTQMGELRELPLAAIVPYWRNPRRIPDDAVNAIMESIRQFGYQQPIVVDRENVIIIGHTRYVAMRRLGIESAQVIVAQNLDPAKVKQLRVMDNKVREFSSWDYDKLVGELSELDADLMRAWFPEVGQLTDDGPDAPPDSPPPGTLSWDDVEPMADFTCPSCFHSWSVEVTVEAVKSGTITVTGPVHEGASA